jgi:hypothetical protein
MRKTAALLLNLVALVLLGASPARAAVLLDQASIIGLPSVAPPAEYSFTICRRRPPLPRCRSP